MFKPVRVEIAFKKTERENSISETDQQSKWSVLMYIIKWNPEYK